MLCKIIIKDEVNCKLEGLDLNTRRKLQRKFEVEIPHARYLPSVRLGRWNGKTSYFDLGGRTYVKLLDDIVPILVDENYDIELEDHRTKHNFEFDAITEDELAHMNWPPGHTAAGTPIKLRDYQIEIINKYLGDAQCLQEIATGAGKTIITATLSRKCQQYGRTIVIVPNKDLVRQTKQDYENIGLDVGVYFGDSKQVDKMHTICTWQSLNNLFKNKKELDEVSDNIEIFLNNQIAIIVDECFHPESLVLTPTGYKEIYKLNLGETVINYSEKDNIFKEDTIVKIHKNLTKSSTEKMYELTFDNGQAIKVTGNHKFLTQKGWVRADELTENDEVKNINT
jgi:hypothetical protein